MIFQAIWSAKQLIIFGYFWDLYKLDGSRGLTGCLSQIPIEAMVDQALYQTSVYVANDSQIQIALTHRRHRLHRWSA